MLHSTCARLGDRATSPYIKFGEYTITRSGLLALLAKPLFVVGGPHCEILSKNEFEDRINIHTHGKWEGYMAFQLHSFHI